LGKSLANDECHFFCSSVLIDFEVSSEQANIFNICLPCVRDIKQALNGYKNFEHHIYLVIFCDMSI